MRFDLTDEEWAVLEPLLPTQRKSARVDDRRIMNAIFYILRTGMPWRDLPEQYGPYTTAYNRFNRWSGRGIWKRVFERFAATSRDGLHLIDSTVVKAHRSASGAKGGRKIRRLASAAVDEARRSTPTSIAKVGHCTLSLPVARYMTTRSFKICSIRQGRRSPLPPIRPTTVRGFANKSKTRVLFRSFQAVIMPARKPTVPSASIAVGTRLKTSSVVSKIGDASPHGMTNSPATFSPPTSASQPSIGYGCESRP